MYASQSTTSTDINLEIEYSPMCSSNRDDPDEVINQFVRVHTEETARLAKIYNRRDVSYGDSEMESMDIWFKSEELNTPIFVFVHGGYWIMGDKSNFAICVAPLVERGYRVIILDYNLCPGVTLEQLVVQMRMFMKCLLEYGVKTNAGQINLCGHSAGAHLLTALLQKECLEQPHSDLIKEMFLISGVYDLRELRKTEIGNPGNILSLDEESVVRLSPILYSIPASVRNIKVHILAAEFDSNTFRGQSEAYFKKLEAEQVPTIHKVFPGYDHFTIVEEMRCENSEISRYVIDALMTKK